MVDPSRRLEFTGSPLEAALGSFDQVVLPARALRARLTGLLFDSMRTFLLPGALAGMRRLKELHAEHPGAELLVVGHCDAAGQARYNLKLSRERAEVVAAFLRDDVDHWLSWYRYANDPALETTPKRWDAREDKAMLSALGDSEGPFWTGPADATRGARFEAAVTRFQRWSNATRGTALDVDGGCGDLTRRALVGAYLGHDGVTLPAGTVLLVHGCGEHHPRAKLEGRPAEGSHVAEDRRVELFLFEDEVAPPPVAACPGPDGCAEYARWVGQLTRTIDLGEALPRVTSADWGEATHTDTPGERKARFGDEVSLVARVEDGQPGDHVHLEVRTADGVTLALLEAPLEGGVARATWRVDTGEQHPPRTLTFTATCVGASAASPPLEVLPEDLAFTLDLFDDVRLPADAKVRFEGLPQPLELVVGERHDEGLGLYRLLVEAPPQRARVTATLVAGARSLVLFRDVDLQAWVHGVADGQAGGASFPLRLPDDAFEARAEVAPEVIEPPGSWWDRVNPEEERIDRPGDDGSPSAPGPREPLPTLTPGERTN